MKSDVDEVKLKLSDEYHYQRLKLAEDILLPKAALGELWAIQNTLKLVSEALADGAKINPQIALFISTALKKIHDGEKADDAFGIARKRGEKDNRRARRQAYSMADYIQRLRFHKKETLENAIRIAADKHHVSFDTAKKAWQKNHKEVSRIMELEKNSLGKVMPI